MLRFHTLLRCGGSFCARRCGVSRRTRPKFGEALWRERRHATWIDRNFVASFFLPRSFVKNMDLSGGGDVENTETENESFSRFHGGRGNEDFPRFVSVVVNFPSSFLLRDLRAESFVHGP